MPILIGERRAPAPNNQPGYLRLDSVHQGDQDGVKGVSHINTVDCVTQYEGVATYERISEAFFIPVLEALLHSFPFVIKGFHPDNDSGVYQPPRRLMTQHVAHRSPPHIVLPAQQRYRPG